MQTSPSERHFADECDGATNAAAAASIGPVAGAVMSTMRSETSRIVPRVFTAGRVWFDSQKSPIQKLTKYQFVSQILTKHQFGPKN